MSATNSPTLEMLEAELAREQHRRSRVLSLFAIAAVVISLGVAFALRQGGLAFTSEEQVLACSYDGIAAHTHDEYCYDEYGNLVCTMPEHELHVHDESCYDEEGNLVCGLDDYTHEHVHGPGCFETIVVEEPDYEDEAAGDEEYDEEASDPETLGDPVEEPVEPEAEAEADADVSGTAEGDLAKTMPKQSFQTDLYDEYDNHVVTVMADAPVGAFPAATTMEVEVVTTDEIEEAIVDAVETETGGRVLELQSVDIAFYNETGERIKPAKPVTIKLVSDLLSNGEENLVLHVNEDGEAEVVSTLDEDQLAEREETVEDDQVVFDTETF